MPVRCIALCSPSAMLSIIIPTLNAADGLQQMLQSLKEVANSQLIICDGGSDDGTLNYAGEAGVEIVCSEKGRGIQLAAGANIAAGDWLLFLHADTSLAANWHSVVEDFIATSDTQNTAAVFRFRLDDTSSTARILEYIVYLRTKLFALPYGDQGLLISRKLYDEVGGFRPIAIMEDVDIIRRIGRRRLTVLACTATTSAARYRRDGYLRRMARNVLCITMWFAGVPPKRIARVYR